MHASRHGILTVYFKTQGKSQNSWKLIFWAGTLLDMVHDTEMLEFTLNFYSKSIHSLGYLSVISIMQMIVQNLPQIEKIIHFL